MHNLFPKILDELSFNIQFLLAYLLDSFFNDKIVPAVFRKELF